MTSTAPPPLPDDTPEWLRILVADLDQKQQLFDSLWPQVQKLHRLYCNDESELNKANLEAMIRDARAAKAALDAASDAVYEAVGLDPAEPAQPAPPIGDPFPAISREMVVKSAPSADAYVDEHLPQALGLIERHAPPGWLESEPVDLFRLSTTDNGEPISIVKGVRLSSELSAGHRLRKAVQLTRDYLAHDIRYDHFAGARAITQLAQLANRAEVLGDVRGASQRIAALFSRADPDATMFELLVAGACAAKGRDMSFVETSQKKSPDLMCHDLFEMVVECKRSAALSNYEVVEEATMQRLFRTLAARATQRGQFGLYEVELTVETSQMDIEEVTTTCLLQRLRPHPEQALAYPWGSVAFRSLPSRFELGGPTKAYSPIMLEEVFGWDTELPDWDGLICKIAAAPASRVDCVRQPIAISWRVVTEEAIKKRSRAPINLFGKALTQIPRGEFGLVYVAYTEGGRSGIADTRSREMMDRVRDWEHDASIRVPAAFFVRQYPFPSQHGNPDVIESTIRMLNGNVEEGDWIFREYPSAIYTSRER